MIAAIILVVFPFAMIYAALSDALTMTIANRVSGLLIVTFLLIAPFIFSSWSEFGLHVLGFAVVLAATFTLFALGTMGGGDAKLMASTALWMGFTTHLMTYLLIATVAGGVLTLLLMALRNSSFSVFVGEVPALRRIVDEKDIPYGIALATGGLVTFVETAPMVYALNYFAS
ncbi:MAG: prepilin peptidase [Ahrensia sp.]|nr:prepilin peptidase [Ahrensia sp.]